MVLSGCALYKAPKVDPIGIPQAFKENLHINNQNVQTEWWKNFHDENLNRLVNKAIHNNLRYQVALSNINVARTYVSQSVINRLIDLNVGYNAQHQTYQNNSIEGLPQVVPPPPENPNINFRNLFASAAYELDIWNKKGNTYNRSKVNVHIQEADSRAVQLALISEVVNSYFQIATLNGLLDNLNRQHTITTKSIDILNVQHRNGFINSSFVNSAKSNNEQIVTNINNLKKQRKVYMNQLAYLLGEYSEEFDYPIKAMPPQANFPALLPPTIPAQVLGNRPDVQKAFLDVLSYGYLKQEVLANFLPSIPLYASLNKEGASLDLITQSSALIIYGLSVTERLTNVARNLSEYRRTKEYYKQATLNYRDVVLGAFREVNNALLAYNEDYKNLNLQKNIQSNTAAQLKTAQDQFKAGAIDYNTYLQAEMTMQQSNYSLDVQKMYVYQDVIQIYKVLGLGVKENQERPNKKTVCCAKPTFKKLKKS